MKVKMPDLMEEITEEDLVKLHVGDVEKPKKKPKPASDEVWLPSLSPTQMSIFNDKTPYLLVEGPRFSGKGWCACYSIARHCFDNFNALALVVVQRKSQAVSGGCWYKLATEVLPDFQKNLEGFEFKGPVCTPEKHLVYWIRNRYGSWSAVQLMSFPYGENLEKYVKGIEASMVYVDELTEFEHDTYFTKLITVLGRRKHIPRQNQQYLATCNPKSPSHWVYQRFHVLPFKNGGHDVDYKFVFLSMEENPDPDARAYLKKIIDGAAEDPIGYQRDVLGEWVERPSGAALFASHFVEGVHVRGNLAAGEILHPKPNLIAEIGYDLGDVNSAMVFLQQRQTATKSVYVVFDELIYVDQKISYDDLVPELLTKMESWGEEESHAFTWMHVSDKSAFDRFRAASGSYDHRMIEQISRSHLLTTAGKQMKWVNRSVKLLECPKPSGSVAGRIKLLRGLLAREEIYISAKCKAVIAMLNKLESEKDEPFVPKRNRHLHVFDALTYPLYYASMGGHVVASASNAIQPELRQFS